MQLRAVGNNWGYAARLNYYVPQDHKGNVKIQSHLSPDNSMHWNKEKEFYDLYFSKYFPFLRGEDYYSRNGTTPYL